MRNRWYALPYETSACRGVLLRSFPDAPGPRVRIDFEARGHFAIHLGIHYAMIDRDDLAVRFGAVNEFARLRIRLAGDDAFSLVLPEEQNVKSDPDPTREVRQNAITEVFWRNADLEGASHVEIEPGVDRHEPCPGNPACLAWIRLEPLADARWRLATSLEPRPDTRRNTAAVSVADPSGVEGPGPIEAALATSDIDRIYADMCRFDVCRFPTDVGLVAGDVEWDSGNFEFNACRALRDQIDAGRDPLAEIVRVGARHGVAVYLAIRMCLQRDPPQHLGLAANNPLLENRHWWIRDRRGDAYPHPALAVPEVRRRLTDLFRDVVRRYDVAGICIHGNRGWPWVGYETESARLFEAEHGTPIRDVDETDSRFVEHRCRVMTHFIQEVRQTIDDVGRERGRRFRLAIDAMNCIENNRGQGLDVVEWANAGLIDELTINACHWSARPVDREHPEPGFVRTLRQAIRDPHFSLRAHLWPRFMNPRKYLRMARAMLDAGADGIAMWDLGHRLPRLSEWAVQRHLGHVDLYDDIENECDRYWRSVPLLSLDGMAMTNPQYSAASAG